MAQKSTLFRDNPKLPSCKYHVFVSTYHTALRCLCSENIKSKQYFSSNYQDHQFSGSRSAIQYSDLTYNKNCLLLGRIEKDGNSSYHTMAIYFARSVLLLGSCLFALHLFLDRSSIFVPIHSSFILLNFEVPD